MPASAAARHLACIVASSAAASSTTFASFSSAASTRENVPSSAIQAMRIRSRSWNVILSGLVARSDASRDASFAEGPGSSRWASR